MLAELESAATPNAETWAPIRINATRKRQAGFFSGEAPPPLGRFVQVTFDYRVPLKTLIWVLKDAWPDLRKDGSVRTTRPLGERKIALLRLACFQMPEASREERFVAWNKEHPDDRFPTRQSLITEMHSAEESLIGDRHGLAWFYDAKARLSWDDLEALSRQGDASARRELDRRKSDGYRSMSDAGLKVIVDGKVQDEG